MSAPPPPVPPRTYRPRAALLVVVPLAALCVLTGAGLALLVVGVTAFDRVAFVALGLALAGGVLLMGRPALRVDDAGLTVVNLLQRRRLEWAQVLAVHYGRGASWASLDVSDGTTVAVMALQSADGARTAQAVAEVRALAEARGAAGAPGPRPV